jgi:hypothetical protein
MGADNVSTIEDVPFSKVMLEQTRSITETEEGTTWHEAKFAIEDALKSDPKRLAIAQRFLSSFFSFNKVPRFAPYMRAEYAADPVMTVDAERCSAAAWILEDIVYSAILRTEIWHDWQLVRMAHRVVEVELPNGDFVEVRPGLASRIVSSHPEYTCITKEPRVGRWVGSYLGLGLIERAKQLAMLDFSAVADSELVKLASSDDVAGVRNIMRMLLRSLREGSTTKEEVDGILFELEAERRGLAVSKGIQTKRVGPLRAGTVLGLVSLAVPPVGWAQLLAQVADDLDKELDRSHYCAFWNAVEDATEKD